MTDIVTPERRSAMMARIGSKDTQPELRVRRMAHDLPGTPDMVLLKYRVALFVHGYWHRHEGSPKAFLSTYALAAALMFWP